MRIALMIDSLTIGGAQKDVTLLACRLRAEGHAVWVICLNDHAHPKYTEPMIAAGVRVSVLGKTAVVSGRALASLPFRLLAWRTDVLAVCLFVSTIIGRLCAGLVRIPVLNMIKARNVAYRPWQFVLMRATAPLSYFSVANSRSAIVYALEHEGVPRRKISYLPNIVEPPACTTPKDWRELSLPDFTHCFVIGSLGRLVWEKGYDLLIPIAALAVKKNPALRFVIFGHGPDVAMLRGLITQHRLEQHFFLLGERTDAAIWLPSMSLYLQPSRSEGTPNALIEAIAAGVPVLASAVDGMLELLSAWPETLFNLSEPEALAERLAAAEKAPHMTAPRPRLPSAEETFRGYLASALGANETPSCEII